MMHTMTLHLPQLLDLKYSTTNRNGYSEYKSDPKVSSAVSIEKSAHRAKTKIGELITGKPTTKSIEDRCIFCYHKSKRANNVINKRIMSKHE